MPTNADLEECAIWKLDQAGYAALFIPVTTPSSPIHATTQSQRRHCWTSCAPWRISCVNRCDWAIGRWRQRSRIERPGTAHPDRPCCCLPAGLRRARGGPLIAPIRILNTE